MEAPLHVQIKSILKRMEELEYELVYTFRGLLGQLRVLLKKYIEKLIKNEKDPLQNRLVRRTIKFLKKKKKKDLKKEKLSMHF